MANATFNKLKMVGSLTGEALIQTIARQVKKGNSFSRGSIIVDIDGTLLDTNLSIELLKTKLGEKAALEKYQEFKQLVLSGEMNVDQMFIKAHKYLCTLNPPVTRVDYEKTLTRVLSEGKEITPVREAIQYAHRVGREVVLITKSSEVFAQLLAARYLGDARRGIGAEEIFTKEGILKGVKTIVAEKNKIRGNTHGATKLELLRQWHEHMRVPFNPRATILLSDSLFDRKAFRQAGVGILYIPANPGKEQKIMETFRLRDYAAKSGKTRKVAETTAELKRALRAPMAVRHDPMWVKHGISTRKRRK